MKKVAIVQSNYIPWKGYFDLIAAVDEFMRGGERGRAFMIDHAHGIFGESAYEPG